MDEQTGSLNAFLRDILVVWRQRKSLGIDLIWHIASNCDDLAAQLEMPVF